MLNSINEYIFMESSKQQQKYLNNFQVPENSITYLKTDFYDLNLEYYTAERKKDLLPFATAWMELESIMLSEISQAVKHKCHMISPISGT